MLNVIKRSSLASSNQGIFTDVDAEQNKRWQVKYEVQHGKVPNDDD